MKPELPEPDGVVDVVVGTQRVGGMIADVIEPRDAWSEEKMHAFYAEGFRAGIERAAQIVTTGEYCREVEHVQGCCDCGDMAAAIRGEAERKDER